VAIKKQFNDMDTKKVWETIKKEDILKGRRTMNRKWIFKSNETEFLEPDSLNVDTVKFRVTISTNVLPCDQ
jgi:hypothetical protein